MSALTEVTGMSVATNGPPGSVNISGNNNTFYINSSVSNNNSLIQGGRSELDRYERVTSGLNTGLAVNEVNDGMNGRLKDIMEESMRKYESESVRESVLREILLEILENQKILENFDLLRQNVKKQDVQWTTNKFVGGVHSNARDSLYEHFEVPEEDVADIRSNLRKEESVVDEVYKVLNHGLRVRVQRTRGYLLRKLFERDENLARSFIDYLFEEMINESKRDADRRENGGSCHSPPLCIQNATNDETART